MRSVAWLPIGSALLLASCSDPDSAGEGSVGPRAVVVDAKTVETVAVDRYLEAIGSLEASERITVASEIAGIVRHIDFQEGQELTPDEGGALPVLFRLDTDLLELQLRSAEAALALADAEIAEQQSIHDRKKQMWEEDAAPRAAYTDAKLALERVKARRAQVDAALEIAKERLAQATIRAPLAGLAGERQVGPGDYVNAGDPLVEIVQTDPVEVTFAIAERYRAQLRPGLEVILTTDAHPDREFRGEAFFVDPRADRATRTVEVKARLDNPDGALSPGLFVRVRLVTGEARSSLVVPEEAIVPRGDRFFVYTVEPAGTEAAPEAGRLAKRREVQPGQRLPGRVVVTSGLEGGELVITAGLQKVSDGYSVRVRAEKRG